MKEEKKVEEVVKPTEAEAKDAQERIKNALDEITPILEKYEVGLLPRMDYDETGKAVVLITLANARPIK